MPRIRAELGDMASPASTSQEAESFHLTTSREGLAAVHRDEVNIAIWRRWVSESKRRSLERWARTAAERVSATIDAERFSAALVFPALTTFAEAKGREWLACDIDDLVRLFAELTGNERFNASFGGVHTDRCRKFHIDYVRMRLVTTYAGPGTEWLPNHALHRDILREPPECYREANAAIVKDGRLVRRARAGDVVVMKGELAIPGGAAVHRSPPIESSGHSRLMLTLTTIEARAAPLQRT